MPEKLYYIDYECNLYCDEWNFENRGIKYWSKTKEFIDYMNSQLKKTAVGYSRRLSFALSD